MNVITSEQAVGLVREAVGLILEARECPDLTTVLAREVMPADEALARDLWVVAEVIYDAHIVSGLDERMLSKGLPIAEAEQV